jgi:hypothetical protein
MIHLLNCKEVTTRLALGDLSHYPWRERLLIRFHLAICWICRKYERQMNAISQAFKGSIETRLHQEDISKFHERLASRLGKL